MENFNFRTLNDIKNAIDETIENKGFLNFYAHHFKKGMTKEELIEILDYVLAYIADEKCIVTTASKGYSLFYQIS